MGREKGLRPRGHEHAWTPVSGRLVSRLDVPRGPSHRRRAGAAPQSQMRCLSMRIAAFVLVLLCGLVRAGWAADEDAGNPQADKSSYNLLNPTPLALMRELTPDRPDKTESPYTVDAGHFQLEMDFANYTYNESGGTTTRAWNLAPFNLKAGLLNNVDLQFVFDNYLDVRTESHAASTTQ